MLDAQTRINAIFVSANLSPDDAEQATRTLEQLGNVIASSNLMASNMIAALSTNESDTLATIEKEFQETRQRIRSDLDLLPKNAGSLALKDTALKLLTLADGKAGVFQIRREELDANDRGQAVLEQAGQAQ